MLSIGLNRAVALIADKQNKGPGRGRGAVGGRELGEHPTLGGQVTVRPGRFGAYVNHGKVNATLPKSMPAESVTLEQAVELITAKAGSAPAKPARRAAAKTASGDKPAKKAAPKKAAAKKSPAKKSG